ALTTQRLHHAYLFTGTRGVGKTTVSRILAKSLNCQGPDGQGGITATPCGVCQACRDIDSGRFVDYTELDAASNRGVDEVQSLLEQAVYKPVQGRFKVFMIDEVHMLTNTAFNAMLKTLEEPPEYLKFVLATTDPQKVPVTVLSRCLQFNLRPMAPETVLEHLTSVLQTENVPAEPQALRLLAHMLRQMHRPADALATLDRLIAAHGQRSEPAIREHIAHALYQRTWWIDEPEARCEACDAMSELLDSQPDAALDAWRVEARLLKAEIEHHRGLPQDALATLEAVIERFDGSTDPGAVLRVARARLASVLNLRELAQHAQAQVMCLAVADQIEASLADAAPELRIEGVRALTLFFDGFGIDEHANRAELVGWLLDRYGRDESSQVRRMAVRRAYDWSVGLREQDDGEAALAACERLLVTFGADTD
ncbi:DNA polymerase III subunit gamma/tau, partial [Variovorax sp. RHLX14]|uniref:DNA polymerase III subunit gamma/tau n=1 Tax=Variovorax sp. RHLX14 TaxID=1259731 RepID=UPI003F481C10